MEIVPSIEEAGRVRGVLAIDFWNPIPGEVPAPVSSSSVARDFWQPTIPVQSEAAVEPVAPAVDRLDDFWALDNGHTQHEARIHDWGADTSLPWFDPDLGENPYVVDISPPFARSMAERRGRWLAQLLDIPEPGRRALFARFFGEIFEEFPFQQTFRTLSEVAIGGADADSVRNGCAFRLDFFQAPKLMSRRSARARMPSIDHEPGAMLSWKRAIRIAELCNGENPTDLIDEDWYDEWLALSVGHALYWSYLDYIEWRFKSATLGYWATTYQRSRAEWVDNDTTAELSWLGSSSRTGQLYRGQSEIIGVAYSEPQTARIVPRRSRGYSDPGNRLLDQGQRLRTARTRGAASP